MLGSNSSVRDSLCVSALSKKFGNFTALQNISLNIRNGEFVCFLGPSGCGKTTLIRTIAGLEVQTVGQIEQDGKDISNLPPSERDFGIVFQSYALFPNLSVYDNVAYGLVSRKTRKETIDARVAELLQLVNLEDQSTKYPIQLSGGQQQRVALARALAPSPGLLLLDEPLSALDARVRQHLRHEIRSLQQRLGVTTIMVTHDQEEALTMADRVVVMNEGRVEQVGTPIEIYRHPQTAFVAKFIGNTNFFDCEMLGDSHIRFGNTKLTHADRAAPKSGWACAAVRLEEMKVFDKAPDNPNVLAGRIEAIEFLGQSFRLTIALKTDPNIELFADISAQGIQATTFKVGGVAWVVIPPENLRVFGAGA